MKNKKTNAELSQEDYALSEMVIATKITYSPFAAHIGVAILDIYF